MAVSAQLLDDLRMQYLIQRHAHQLHQSLIALQYRLYGLGIYGNLILRHLVPPVPSGSCKSSYLYQRTDNSSHAPTHSSLWTRLA
jgi:hypothetical protein